MVKRIIVMLIAVAFMATAAQAVLFTDDFEGYTAGGTVTDPPWARIWSNYSTASAGVARVVLDDGSNGTNAMDLVSAAYWGSARHTFAAENQFSAGYVQFDYRGNSGGLRQFFRDDTGRNITEINLDGSGFVEREGTSNAPHDPVNETGAILDSSAWYTLRFDFDFDAPGDLGFWSLSVDGGVVLTGDIDHEGGVSGHYLKDIGWDIAGGSYGALIDNVIVDVPEPATCLLLVSGGLVFLRRRRG